MLLSPTKKVVSLTFYNFLFNGREPTLLFLSKPNSKLQMHLYFSIAHTLQHQTARLFSFQVNKEKEKEKKVTIVAWKQFANTGEGEEKGSDFV
mgnify:CR=1 FL=1